MLSHRPPKWALFDGCHCPAFLEETSEEMERSDPPETEFVWVPEEDTRYEVVLSRESWLDV